MQNNLHVIRNNTLHDIPAELRALADAIEAGVYGKLDTAAVVLRNEDCETEVFGYGDMPGGSFEAITLLHLGASKLTLVELAGPSGKLPSA